MIRSPHRGRVGAGVGGSGTVTTRKLTTTDAFVVVDLPDAPVAAGVARLAPKVLVDGATWLARSQTYQFAVFERRASGASAGVNAPADGRDEALAAFVAELAPDAGTLLLEPARGVGADDLAELRAGDPRPDRWWELKDVLRATGVAAAAAQAAGGDLDGRTVAIEGFESGGPALVAALAERGASVVAVATAKGTVGAIAGLDPSAIVEAWTAHGPALVSELGAEPDGPGAVLGAEADVLLVGSKAGVLGHDAAGSVRARFVVPHGPIPVTAKALAELGRAGTVVLPDFVTTAGHLAAWPLDGAAVPADPSAAAAAMVEVAVGAVLDHPKGPVLGACEQAEAFLSSWTDELPFGRPLAA
jgi:hypothetical protein